MLTTILFIDSHTHPTCLEKFNGVCRFAASREWNVIRRISSAKPKQIKQLLKTISPEGCIVNATRFLDTIPPGIFKGTPVVYLDTNPTLFNARTIVIHHDSYSTGVRAADELMSHSIRHYFYLPYRFPTFWNTLRWKGFSKRLTECGHKGVRLPTKISEIADVIEPESGILAANDEMANILLPVLDRCGLRVPQDVIIISADDSDIARTKELTSIRIDFEHGGYYAAEALSKLMMGHPHIQRNTFGDVCIQYRESTRHFAHKLPRIPEAVTLIRSQACNGLKVSDVIDFIGTPRRTAEEHFRLATGHSIHQEIQSVRMEQVFSLLSTPGRSISSLTDLCGYATPQALRKAFRLHAGLSMKEWKKRELTSHG